MFLRKYVVLFVFQLSYILERIKVSEKWFFFFVFRVHLLSLLSKRIFSLIYFRFPEKICWDEKELLIYVKRDIFVFDICIDLNENVFLDHKYLYPKLLFL